MPTPVPTTNSFLVSFPEFKDASGTLVAAKLKDAAARTNATVFQSADLAEQAVMLRAAILLLRSPYGLKMRLATPDQMFVWEHELRALQRSGTVGMRVF